MYSEHCSIYKYGQIFNGNNSIHGENSLTIVPLNHPPRSSVR